MNDSKNYLSSHLKNYLSYVSNYFIIIFIQLDLSYFIYIYNGLNYRHN